MKEKNGLWLTAAGLHVLAMVFMLCDHIWGVFPVPDVLTCIGRLTFPIFAFLTVEGYYHTKDLKKYMKRLFIAAVLSEIPFNLMMGGRVFYPIHQNVLWTFLLSLLLIRMIDGARRKGKRWLTVLAWLGALVLGLLLGTLTMADYYGSGVWMVLIFYLFHGRKWWHFLGQLAGLYYVNTELLGGIGYELSLLGQEFFLTRQSLALLALIPIWLYRGEQGHHSKGFRLFCYGFYPVHMLILVLIKTILY